MPAPWQHFSARLMFSDDNIWPRRPRPLLAASEWEPLWRLRPPFARISCGVTQPLSLSHFCLPLSGPPAVFVEGGACKPTQAILAFPPGVVVVPNGPALFLKLVLRVGAGQRSSKASCVCFHPLILYVHTARTTPLLFLFYLHCNK